MNLSSPLTPDVLISYVVTFEGGGGGGEGGGGGVYKSEDRRLFKFTAVKMNCTHANNTRFFHDSKSSKITV